MVHTLPDYTTKYKTVKIFGNLDHAELAARLGSIDRFDRRGSIVWYDDFEGPYLLWDEVKDTADGYARLTTQRAYTGSQSVEIYPTTTAVKYAGIKRALIIPQLSKLGFEISFSELTQGKYIRIDVTVYTGEKKLTTGVVIWISQDKLQYIAQDTTWKDIGPSVKVDTSRHLWHTTKLVIDAENECYSRWLFDSYEIDMDGIAVQSTTDDTGPYIEYQIRGYSGGMLTQKLYVDNFIFTQNEP